MTRGRDPIPTHPNFAHMQILKGMLDFDVSFMVASIHKSTTKANVIAASYSQIPM